MARRGSKTIYLRKTKRRKRQLSKNAIIGAVVGACALAGVGFALLPNAYRITENGEVIAIVGKREYIDSALETLRIQLTNQYETEVKIDEIDEIKRVRAASKDMMDPNKLATHLRATLDVELQFQELWVDGSRIGVIESGEALEALKVELKKTYFDDETIEAEFVNEVELQPIFTTEDELLSLDEVMDLVTKRNREIVTYKVQAGDTLSGIATKLGATITDILKENEGMEQSTPLQIGQELRAEVRVPILGLEVIEVVQQ